MYNRKKFSFCIFALFIAFVIAMQIGAVAEGDDTGDKSALSTIKILPGEVSREVTELYNGVISTHIVTEADSLYGLQRMTIIEFDLAQQDLYLDVTGGADYANQLRTVKDTIENFNETNGQNKTAIAAVNGDMWMVSYAHCRYEGCYLADAYKSYANDPVVTKALTLPRGFNMYDGEIITTGHMTYETPFEGEFWSFGVTDDFVPVLGNPQAKVEIENTSRNLTTRADGINRLPAKNALVMYTDKGCLSNYSLDDAYEVVIDFSEDYVVKHGAVLKGTVTAIAGPGDENPSMKENRIILTARGSGKIKRIDDYAVGDSVEISISVTDKNGNDEIWQRVQNAVGGHMQFAVNGETIELGQASRQPITIIGFRNDGKVLLISNDGRQNSTGWSAGIMINQYDDLAVDLDLNSAFIVDGGGSTTLVELAEQGYELKNRPSDKDSNDNYGAPRTVVNSVILSYGPERQAQGEFDYYFTKTALEDFNSTKEAYSAFSSAKQMTKRKNEDETLSLALSGDADPNILVRYGSISADIYKYATIRLKADVSTPESQFGLYLCTGENTRVNDSTPNTSFTLLGDGQWHTYLVDLSAIEGWNGQINSIRLDPFNGGESINGNDVIHVEYMRLFATAEEAVKDRQSTDPQPAESISIISMPAVLECALNGTPDSAGLSLEVKYPGGLSEIVTEGFEISANTSKAGKTLVTVSFGGQTTTYEINVIDGNSDSGADDNGSNMIIIVAVCCVAAVAVAAVVAVLILKKK